MWIQPRRPRAGWIGWAITSNSTKLGDHIKFYKVGLQLFLAGGFPVIDMIIKRGNKVMVDLKFFDIPETVGLAVRALKDKGATFITVHGNDPILRAAVQERDDAKILAVTVLTSFDESDMREMGLTGTIEQLVYHRAKKALDLARKKRWIWVAMGWFLPGWKFHDCEMDWAINF